MDDGFSYRIPSDLSGVRVGSIVRIPLGGRRVRGFVVGVRDGPEPSRPLKDVAGVSGDYGVFDARHLETLRWAAVHYVAPLAAVLRKAAPPNLPRSRSGRAPDPLPSSEGDDRVELSALPEATAAAAAGLRTRPQYLVVGTVTADILSGLVYDVVAAGRSSLVISPTAAEAAATASGLRARFGGRLEVVSSSAPPAEQTKVWVRACSEPGRLVVGTQEAAFWPVHDLAMAVVVEEGRRGMKARQTPTTHVREVLRRRAAVERFQLVFAGPVPTVEAVAAAVDLHEAPGRVWPLVEVVDRTEEPPGSLVSDRVRRALALAAADGRAGFVLVHRRGYAPAFRCVRCRTLRRCRVCGAAAGRADSCRRCGSDLGRCASCGSARFEPLGAGVGRIVEDLKRTLGSGVGAAEDGAVGISVGTERDLATLGRIDIAAAVDIDGLMLAPHYRSAEDALRVVARLAAKLGPGPGRRCIVQTALPSHRVLTALRRGRPLPFLEDELERRRGEGFPPAGELIAVDVVDGPVSADAELRAAVGEGVLGPAEAGSGVRWLIQGPDLRDAKVRMRSLVQNWRDAGARVRVDVDPLDL